MSDPYAVLGLSINATEEDVRARYLELVRKHPPDADPDRFAEIRAAYDHLADPRTRFERQFFSLSDDSLGEIIAEVNAQHKCRIPVADLLDMG